MIVCYVLSDAELEKLHLRITELLAEESKIRAGNMAVKLQEAESEATRSVIWSLLINNGTLSIHPNHAFVQVD